MLQLQKYNKLYVDASKYLSASIISKAISFITIPIYTRLFGLEGYGEYSLYLVVYTFSSLLFEFGTIKTLTRKWYDFETNTDRLKLIFSVFRYQFIINIVIVLVLLLSSEFIASFFKMNILTFRLGIIAALLQLPIKYALMYLQLTRKSTLHSAITILNDGVIKLLTVLSFYIFSNLDTRIYNESIVRIIVAVLLILAFVRIFPFTKIKNVSVHLPFKPLVLASFTLLFHNISTLILSTSDRLIINILLGTSQTAFYSLVYQVALIQSMIISALAISYVPYVFDRIKKEEYQDVNKLNKRITVLVLTIATTLIVLSKEIIWVLGGSPYIPYTYLSYINIIGVSFMSFYTLNSSIMIYFKMNTALALSSFFLAIVNIVLNILLIPTYGILAASGTTLLCYALLFISTYIFVYTKHASFVSQSIPLKSIILGMIFLSLLSYIMYFQNTLFVSYYAGEIAIKTLILGFSSYFMVTNVLKMKT